MAPVRSPRRGVHTLAGLMAAALIVTAPGCSTKAADTTSAGGAASPPASTSAVEPTGALGGALPQGDAAGFTPPHDCGDPNDTKESLWTDVKGRTPADKGPNIKVVVPEKNGPGYALHKGNREGETHKYNLLVIPTARVTGIECDLILNPKDVLNLWKYAWDDARDQFGKSEDIMLGINSWKGRSHNQLHIHLTGFNSDARKQLDKLTNVATDVSQWNKSMHVLGEHAYRIVHVKSLDTNPFNQLQDNVAKPFQDRFDQALAVVADARNGGFYLIATQGRPEVSGQPEHNPELRVDQNGKTYWGSKAIDDLMYLG